MIDTPEPLTTTPASAEQPLQLPVPKPTPSTSVDPEAADPKLLQQKALALGLCALWYAVCVGISHKGVALSLLHPAGPQLIRPDAFLIGGLILSLAYAASSLLALVPQEWAIAPLRVCASLGAGYLLYRFYATEAWAAGVVAAQGQLCLFASSWVYRWASLLWGLVAWVGLSGPAWLLLQWMQGPS